MVCLYIEYFLLQEKEAAKKDLADVQRALQQLETKDKMEISVIQKLEMLVKSVLNCFIQIIIKS